MKNLMYMQCSKCKNIKTRGVLHECPKSPLDNEKALKAVLAERLRQENKWGEQNHDPFTYIAILGEEFGELCQAALHTKFGGDMGGDNLRVEAVQCAAVALAIVECLDRKKWKWPKIEN